MFLFKKVSIYTLCFIVIFSIFLNGCAKKTDEFNSSVPFNKTSQNVSQIDELFDPETKEYNNQNGCVTDYSSIPQKKGVQNGIDVSKWQGNINWSKVKNAGIDFAIIRVGYRGENGVIYKDSFAEYNIQQADKYGILIGVYFFSTAINSNEAIEEANFTLSVIEGYPISYPVIYDCEGYDLSDSRMNKLSKDERTNNAVSFLKTVSDKGYDSMFYAMYSELEESKNFNVNNIENSYKIWIARYSDITYPKINQPQYTGKFDMWQYTNLGKVSGIDKNVDLNVSYFSAIRKEPLVNKKNDTAEAPKQNNDVYNAVNDSVTPKESVNLRNDATTKSDIIATVNNGEILNRIATGLNGWSKINYNGKTVYAVSSYLTTDLTTKPEKQEENDGFSEASGQYTAKDTVNLRSMPNTSSEIIATIKNGEFATRIGVNNNGWTKLIYNNRTVYAVSSFLTTEINKTENNVSSDTNSLTTVFENVGGSVTAKSETNLRTKPTVSDSTVVYTLKNGEYVERNGVSNNGWTRVIYNGQTLYSITSYLLEKE